MRRWSRTWVCFLLLATPATAVQSARVDYEVDVRVPEGRRVRVTMTAPASGELRVALPAWAPGAYRIVPYAQQIKDLSASTLGGEPLEVRSLDAQTWSVAAGAEKAVRIRYAVVADALRFDRTHCFIPGPETYLYVRDRKDLPCTVRYRTPEGWDVGTGLELLEEGLYGARDYDTFVDCPVELGCFERKEFEADGARYEIVIHAPGPFPGDALVEQYRRIVREQNRIFGGPPFERYVFILHFRDGSGGRGLEHLNSTDIVMPYLPVRADPSLMASISSHEYFHLWNVKRIRPFELGPFDYSKPVRSKALWMCEGVTSYYGDRSLVRAGIWKEQQYFDHLASEMETLQNNADRKKTSLEQASLSVWDRKDWPRVDYYNKGELVGLLMDLRIRLGSRGAKTLDDVLRHLYTVYVKGGKGPIGTGFPEDGILAAVEEVTGGDWDAFFDRYVRGVEELPYEEILGAAGLDPKIVKTRVPDLGLDLRGTVVAHVAPGSAAAEAGVQVNDRVAAVGGKAVTRTSLREVVGTLEPGTAAEVGLMRGAAALVVELPVSSRELTTCRLRRTAQPDPLQERLLRSWLQAPRDY
jgi:predicted metalloprotease with PDZ domain